jgi:putative FmdB family regulatory protein
MPLYDYKCSNGHADLNVLLDFSEIDVERICLKCGATMERMVPRHTHAVVDRSWDSRDIGKVFQEKNELLKKKHADSKEYVTPTMKIRDRFLGDKHKNR